MHGEVALDSNIVVDILNGDFPLREKIDLYAVIWLPSIVVGELLYGALISRHSQENADKLSQFAALTRTISCDNRAAEEFARIKAELKRIGKPIPETDIWIAACCSAHNIPLATRDMHFGNIPDFHFESW